jgi:ParB family chromosome partitioning protein
MEEAQGFKALLNLEEPKYSIEQIAAKTGKSPAYVAQRLKLTELIEVAVEAFYRDEIVLPPSALPLPAEAALRPPTRRAWNYS